MSNKNITEGNILPEDYVIWMLNERESKIDLPAIVVVSILMLFGAFGNGFAIYVFRFRFKQTSIHLFIAWLAIFDLISCCISMPFELFELRFPLMYGEPVSCKIFRIVGFIAAMTSATIMIYIAFDRYYTLCNPFQKFSTKKAKLLIFVGFLIALMFAWPSLIIFGSRTIPTQIPGIVGTDCSYDDSVVDTIYPRLYYFILSFSVILCLIILTVVYIKIGIGIWKWKHTDIGDSYIDASSVSTENKLSPPKKHNRSYSLPPIRNAKYFIQNSQKGKELKNSKVQLETTSLESLGDNHIKGDNLKMEVVLNLCLSPTDNSRNSLKNSHRYHSLENIIHTKHLETKEVIKRNASLPDLLQNVQASSPKLCTHKITPAKPSHGILLKRDCPNSPTSSRNNDSHHQSPHKKLQKRISSVDFKLDENLHFQRSKSLSRDNVHSAHKIDVFSDSQYPNSNGVKLRTFASLDSLGNGNNEQQNKKSSIYGEMHRKVFNRMLSSSSTSSTRSFKRQNSAKDKARIGRSNAMFVAITVVFILSYIPFFTLEILKNTGVIDLDTSSELARQMFEVGTKTQYLNNVANPFIYGMLNSKFRREIKRLFSIKTYR